MSNPMTGDPTSLLQFILRRGESGPDPGTPTDAQHAMDQTSQLMEAILDGMQEGLVAIDSNTEVILYNRAASRIFELPPQVPLPRPRLIEVTRDPEINDVFRSVLKSGIPDQRRVEVRRRGNRVFALNVNPIGPGSLESSKTGAAGVFFDITELERLERIRRDFFANLSHELRTPLTAVLAYIETLLDGAIDDPQNSVRFLGIVQKHALRMQTLVQDITDLSMIESGEVTLNIEVHDLGQIVEEMLVLAGARAESAEITIVNRVPRGFRICADRYRLEQILNNLVDNAIKFNRPGGRVEILAEKSDCGTSIIQVRDNGTGVSKADLSRVFERFFRADRSRSRDAGGSGLGLAIVKHLARAHGGSVRVESEQMKGSTFSVELPNCESCE